jgi:hypothetical protein
MEWTVPSLDSLMIEQKDSIMTRVRRRVFHESYDTRD